MQNNNTVAVATPAPASLLPTNKLCQSYLDLGYELKPDFLVRTRVEAQEEANRLRAEGKQSALINLKEGWLGVFVREAPAKESTRAHKPTREYPSLQFGELSFATTKEARAFAAAIVEAAKNAEFEADLAAAQASKA